MAQQTGDKPKTLRFSSVVAVWLGVFALIALPTVVLLFEGGVQTMSSCTIWSCFFGVAGASIAVFLLLFIHWLRSRGNVRRLLVVLAVLATLWAAFVVEENWRCKRDWENYKRTLQAKGEWHEWDEFVPPPVPDEENVFKAPHIAECFTRNLTSTYRNDMQKRYTDELTRLQKTHAQSFIVGELIFVRPGEAAPTNVDAEITLADSSARNRVRQLIEDSVGPICDLPQSYTVLAHPPESIKPVRIAVRAEQVPDLKELERQIPKKAGADGICLPWIDKKTSADPRVFRLSLNFGVGCWLASEYLQASAENEPFFVLIDEALKRPKLRMDGDYVNPFAMPIPNFVCLRNCAQELCARAQCYFLLGHPDKAVRELARLHKMRRLLLDQRPMSLVSAMINVAIVGLATETIAEGFRLNAWRDEDLAALEKQLQEADLLPPVDLALQMARISGNRFCDQCTGRMDVLWLKCVSRGGSENYGLVEKLTRLAFRITPSGWLYQNQRIYNETMNPGLSKIYDETDNQVHPAIYGQFEKKFDALARASWPYQKYAKNMLSLVGIPNYSRAVQTATRNQTRANLALIACALERYHHAHGEYPETLDALAPQFVDKIPRDIIGGAPLKYRRTDGGKFLLYSIGWNEKDDGGKVVGDKDGKAIRYAVDGDWAWDVPAL